MLPTYWQHMLSLRKFHHVHRTIPPPSLGTSSLPVVTHTQASKSTPEQLRDRRSGRDAGVMMPNALQPSCVCFCFYSDGPVFLPSRTSPDCRFPLMATLLLSVYSNQYTQVAVYTSYSIHSLEVVGGVARMTKQACHVANRPQASALEQRSRSCTAEIRLSACHVAHCS